METSKIPNISTNGFNHLSDSIGAVGDLTKGLSLSFGDGALSLSLQEAVNSQQKMLETINAFDLKVAGSLGSLSHTIGSAIAPLSGALADMGLASTALKSIQLGKNDALKFSSAFERISMTALDCVKGYQEYFNTCITKIDTTGVAACLEKLSPSTEMVGHGLGAMMQSVPWYPSMSATFIPSLSEVKKAGNLSGIGVERNQSHLDALLEKIDPGLVIMRKGCWEAFRGKKADYIGQASSSMRRLVDTLLHTVAPDNKVQREENKRPTRKERIYYAVSFEKKKTEHLKRMTEGFLSVYDNLPAWDHKPLQKDAFVEGTLIAIEGFLCAFLSEL